MPSTSPANSSKSPALAANAMINEGGAIKQPSKEESEAALEHVIEEQQSEGSSPPLSNRKGGQEA